MSNNEELIKGCADLHTLIAGRAVDRSVKNVLLEKLADITEVINQIDRNASDYVDAEKLGAVIDECANEIICEGWHVTTQLTVAEFEQCHTTAEKDVLVPYQIQLKITRDSDEFHDLNEKYDCSVK